MANIHGIRPFCVEFPVVSQRAGNLQLETGSIQAASTTTQSDENRWSSADDKPVTFAERLNQAEGLPRSHLAARRSRGRWRRVQQPAMPIVGESANHR